MGSHSIHQGTFPTQGSNPGLPLCGRILCQLSYQGSPVICSAVLNSLQPMDYIACQAPLSRRFPRQEYWSGLPFPSSEDLCDQVIEHMSPALADSLLSEPPGKSIALVSSISSVAPSCPTLCDHMNRSTPGHPVHHQLPSSLKLMSI